MSLVLYKKSLEVREKLVKENPIVAAYQSDLAQSHNNLGNLYKSTGNLDNALMSHKKSLEIQEKLVEENPTVTEYQSGLAQSHNNLGNLYKSIGKLDSALSSFKKELEMQKRLVEENPSITRYQNYVVDSHNSIGVLYISSGKPRKALASYKKAIEKSEKLVEENPNRIQFAISLGGIYVNTAVLAASQNEYKNSERYFDLGVKTLNKVIKTKTHPQRAIKFSRNAYWGRAQLMEKMGRFGEAVSDWEKVSEFSSSSDKLEIRQIRVIVLVKSKKYRLAYSEAKKLAEETQQLPAMQYNMSCVITLASDVAKDDKTLSVSEKKEIIARYRNEAIDLLKHAQKLGFFKTAANLKLIQTDTDLDPLRKHDEFKKLLAEIETAAKAKLQKQKAKSKPKKQPGTQKKKNKANRDIP